MFGVVKGNLAILADQFTLCFLIIMGLFAISNIFLKFNRDRLVRESHVLLPLVILALVIVCVTIVGKCCLLACYGRLLSRVFPGFLRGNDVYWNSRTTYGGVILGLLANPEITLVVMDEKLAYETN